MPTQTPAETFVAAIFMMLLRKAAFSRLETVIDANGKKKTISTDDLHQSSFIYIFRVDFIVVNNGDADAVQEREISACGYFFCKRLA